MKNNREIIEEAKAGLKGNWGPLVLIFTVLLFMSMFLNFLGDLTDAIKFEKFRSGYWDMDIDLNLWDDDDDITIMKRNLDNDAKNLMHGLGDDGHMVKSGLVSGMHEEMMGGKAGRFTLMKKNPMRPMHGVRYFVIFLSILFTFIINPVLLVGKGRLFTMLHKEGKVYVKNILYGFYNNFSLSITTFLRISIVTLLWSLLLIIPGLIYGLSVFPYYFILSERNDLSTNEVLLLSKKMMYGHKWQLFCLALRFTGWAILSLISFGIGFIWLAPYYHFALAKFYEELKMEHDGLFGKSTSQEYQSVVT